MEDGPTRPSWPGALGAALLLALIGVVAVYGFAHVTIRPIHPDQKTPEGHFDIQCSLCHQVSAKAKLVEE